MSKFAIEKKIEVQKPVTQNVFKVFFHKTKVILVSRKSLIILQLQYINVLSTKHTTRPVLFWLLHQPFLVLEIDSLEGQCQTFQNLFALY